MRDGGPIEATPEEWITCHSFLGRLTDAGLVDYWGLELWIMHCALSKEHWQAGMRTRPLDCVVLAAGEYMRHAHDELAKGGSRASGWVRLLSVAKWNYWIDRSREVAELLEEGPARQAVLNMQRLMSDTGDRYGFTN